MSNFHYKGYFTVEKDCFLRFSDSKNGVIVDIPKELFEPLQDYTGHAVYIPFLFSTFFDYEGNSNHIKNPEVYGRYVEVNCNNFYYRYPVNQNISISRIKDYMFYLDNFIHGCLYPKFNISEKSMTHVDNNGNLHVILEVEDTTKDIFTSTIKTLNEQLSCTHIDDDTFMLSLKYSKFSSFPTFKNHYKFVIDEHNGLIIDEANIMYQIPPEFNTNLLPSFNPSKNTYILTNKNIKNLSCPLRTFYDKKSGDIHQMIGMFPYDFPALELKAKYAISYVKNMDIVNELSTSSMFIPCFDYKEDLEFSIHIDIDYSLLPFDREVIKDYIEREFVSNNHEKINHETLQFTDYGIRISGHVD